MAKPFNWTVINAIMSPVTGLLPCPFCGGGEFEIKPLGQYWAGMRYSEPTSWEIRHWCPPTKGQPHPRMISRVGRDEASARQAWNQRAESPK